jgi:ABC-type transport system involved in multi-copper enzyme maturation permease subunit
MLFMIIFLLTFIEKFRIIFKSLYDTNWVTWTIHWTYIHWLNLLFIVGEEKILFPLLSLDSFAGHLQSKLTCSLKS